MGVGIKNLKQTAKYHLDYYKKVSFILDSYNNVVVKFLEFWKLDFLAKIDINKKNKILLPTTPFVVERFNFMSLSCQLAKLNNV